MLDNVKDFFTDAGIDIEDIMDKIAYSIPAVAFDNDKKIVEITYTLASSSVAPYTYIEFDEQYFIEHIYNATMGKISDESECSITTPLDSSESADLSESLDNIVMAQYGMGYIVENLTDESTITIRLARVDRSSANLNIDIYNSVLLLLYYAYIQQPGDLYQYSRALSFHKANVASENKKVMKPFRPHRIALKPVRI